MEKYNLTGNKYILANHDRSKLLGTMNDDGMLWFTDPLFCWITGSKKWYVGYCSQQNASAIMKRYKAGTLSNEKITHLFNHFGYKKSVEQWEKK